MPRKAVRSRGQTGRGRLTEPERLMRERLAQYPLASTYDLAGLGNVNYTTCDRILKSLETRGFAAGLDAGYSQRRQRRYAEVYRSTGKTADAPTPKYPGLVDALLTRITLTEAVYLIIERVVQEVPGRRLLDFQWRFDSAVDATARFSDGWIAFKWSGIWQSAQALGEKMEQLNNELRAWRIGGTTPIPGRICFIVPDAWQAQLVDRVVEKFGFRERCLIYDADSALIAGDWDLSGSRSWPPPIKMNRWSRKPDRLDTLMRTVMDDADAKALIRCLTTVEQWPGIRKNPLKNLTRLNGTRLKASLTQLIDLGLVWRTDRAGYAPGTPWLSIAARRDRVWSGLPGYRFDPDKVAKLYAGRIATHEEGLARLTGWFAAAGCPVAPGWRFRDVMGRQGQMAPDAMVLLKESPFGATWCYVEYERRATTPKTAEAKLRAYRSHLRSDDYPVLIVCRRKAIPNFLRQGAGLRMLIAAVEDVRQQNVTGETATVWLQDGNPVPRLR